MFRTGIPDFEMQVWSPGRSGITTKSNRISLMEDQLPVPHLFIYFKAFLLVLNLPDKRCDTSVETLQMSVNRGRSILMLHIQYLPIAGRRHTHPDNFTVFHTHNRQSFHPTGPDINTRMEVSRPQFSEISTQQNRPIDRLYHVLGKYI